MSTSCSFCLATRSGADVTFCVPQKKTLMILKLLITLSKVSQTDLQPLSRTEVVVLSCAGYSRLIQNICCMNKEATQYS